MDAIPAKDVRISGLAGAQHGVASRAQLRLLGLTADEIDTRIAAQRLHRLHRGVYAVGHTVVTAQGRWMAATLATGGVLSHGTAAAAWDLARADGGAIHVTTMGWSGRERRAGIRIHRSTTLRSADTTARGCIPVTTPIRTVLDLAVTLERRALEELLDRAEELIDFADLRRRLEAHPARPGAPALRATLSEYRIGSIVTRSWLEETFLRLCDRHDLPRPLVNIRIEGITVDFAWKPERLIVEVDGWKFHRGRTVFRTDRERDVRLEMAGWRVLRFTWEHLTDRPAWVAAAIATLLAG